MPQRRPSTPTRAGASIPSSQGTDPERPKFLDRNPSPSPSPQPSQSQSPLQEPNLSGNGSGSAEAGELGADFTAQGPEQQPEPEVLDPELLNADEFLSRFASWFDMPYEALGGNPSPASRDAAAKALHAEISKSKSAWFRALASRKVGSIGNWGVVALFLVSMVRQAAGQMQAAQAAHGGPAGGQAGAPEGGRSPFPDVDMSGKRS